MISPSISNMSLSNKQKLCHELPLPNHFLRVELNPQKRRGRFHRFSPTWQESISSMKREMMRAGLIEELLDEGMEEMVSWRCVNVWVGWSHDSIFSCWNLKSFFFWVVWLINWGERGPWLVSFSPDGGIGWPSSRTGQLQDTKNLWSSHVGSDAFFFQCWWTS